MVTKCPHTKAFTSQVKGVIYAINIMTKGITKRSATQS
jgi:hypothetical protein